MQREAEEDWGGKRWGRAGVEGTPAIREAGCGE